MKAVFQRIRLFLLLQTVWLCVAIPAILLTGKAELHLWINRWHHPLADVVFTYATYLAEGYFLGLVFLLAMLNKVRHGVALLCTYAFSALITQGLKRLVFHDRVRPHRFFQDLADLRLVDGISMHQLFSFPSGHATAAFAVFLFIAYISKYRWVQGLCFGLALVSAFSRVYLSQHFMEDIVAGSIVGTIVTLAVTNSFAKWTWGERGILRQLKIN